MLRTFGDRLRSLRVDNDITTDEFIRIFHISQRALSHYELNERQPSFKLLVQFADYFNVSLDFLLCRNDDPAPFHKYKNR